MFDTVTRGGASAAGEFEVERSLRFNSADSANLSYTPSSDGNKQKFTFSLWHKKTYGTDPTGSKVLFSAYAGVGGAGNYGTDRITIMQSGSIQVEFYNQSNGSHQGEWRSAQYIKDVSGWYHIVVAIDSTQSTQANRMKLYINNKQITTWDVDSSSSFSQNASMYGWNNSGHIHHIGSYAYQENSTGSSYLDGYISDFYFIDDQQLTPSSFAETNSDTGQWLPKKYVGTYNAQSYHLTFSDNTGTTATTLGKDSSGESNNWTPNNLSVAAGNGCDSVIDTPTNNFPTYLSTQGPYDGSGAEDVVATFSNGNLDTVTGGTGTYAQAYTTMAFPTTGKWYVETAMTSNYDFYAGVGAFHESKNQTPTDARVGVDFYSGDGFKNDTGGSTTGIDLGFSQWDNSGGMVLGIALNMDDNEATFYRDNVAASSAISFTWSAKDKEKIFFYANDGGGAVSSTTTWVNFGQRAFATSNGEPPSGYKRLCSKNLPEPTIKDPSEYFQVMTWTGTDANQNYSLNHTSDIFWGQRRNSDHHWQQFDSTMGDGYALSLNNNYAKYTFGGHAFGTDQISIPYSTSDYYSLSDSGDTYVGYSWKESATSGVDVVEYTGNGSARTINHSLNAAPEFIIVKRLDSTSNATAFVRNDRKILLNSTTGSNDDANYWNDTDPTSSVFSLGSDTDVNATGGTYRAYCFAPIAGFSKIGEYIGTGQSSGNQGVFVYTGFKPAFILIRNILSTGNWAINDHKRDVNSTWGNDASLYLNLADDETTSSSLNVDFLCNGFKLRSDNSHYNGNGDTYKYVAFAERPFKYANAE
tara:strand:+ start:2935 stop:5358 length:2424 start_codon:yes stop_codon:yes gene_type:complete